jgi:hypothetical protein
MLTVRKQQKFAIAFGAEDGAIDNSGAKSERFDASPDTIAGDAMNLRVAHDSSFADLAPVGFKLGLDEDDHMTR